MAELSLQPIPGYISKKLTIVYFVPLLCGNRFLLSCLYLAANIIFS